ncbi:threonine/serine exporter family protein [Streptomyces sp. 020-2-3H-GM]|uniref:threonine/serine exporter family protein n=1 Tax=Streptomyces sp. 020-2-3H-GM TaxID=2789258 RepID=UPI00397FCA78
MPRPPHPAPHPAGEHDATSTALAKLLRGTPYEHISFPAARVVPRPEAQSILALAARVGRALFRAGAETQHIEAAVLAVAAAQGMREVTADINARIVTLQYISQGYDPLALMEVIGSEETRNLRHLAQLDLLVLDIAAGHHTPDQARQAFDRAENSPAPSWWQSQAGGALLSSMLCLLAAGTLRAALITPVLFLVAAAVERALAATRLAGFFVTAARVAVLVALVTALVGLGIYSHSEAASTLAGSLILVLPLFTTVSLTEDMISGYRAMAAARAISLLSFFTALATGFALVAFMLRNTESDARSTTLLALPVAVSLLTGAVGALGNTSTWAAPGASSHPRAPSPSWAPASSTCAPSTHSSRSSSPPDWPPGPWASPPPTSPAAPRTLPEGENWPAASTASWCTPNVSAIPQHTTTLSAYNNTRSTSAAKHGRTASGHTPQAGKVWLQFQPKY